MVWGDEDLARSRPRSDALTHMHRDTCDVASPKFDLAGVHTGSDCIPGV